MKKLISAALGLAMLTAACSAAAKDTLSGNIGVTSDYVVRGYTQTDGMAAIQGGVDYTHDTIYASAFASNVAFSAYELDLSVGLRPTLGRLSFDTGLIAHRYADKRFELAEAKAAVSYALAKGSVAATFYDDIDAGSTYYYELSASYPVTDKLTATGAIGERRGPVSATVANLGLTYAVTPAWSIDGRLSSTNRGALDKAAEPRFSLSLKAVF